MASIYDGESAKYRNFLNWLFLTFNEDESAFRKGLIADLRIQPGHKVLVTGCGHGDDIPPIFEAGARDVECIDISENMIAVAKDRLSGKDVKLHVSDASKLHFGDSTFDSAFHFGGINVFSDVKNAIHEMARVVKDGGRVVFGDEGVAPWLRDTDYGKMAINNNPLWASREPLECLPFSATDVSLRWILGNCFYLISFTVNRAGPYMNPDIPHKSPRGGTMRTRYESPQRG